MNLLKNQRMPRNKLDVKMKKFKNKKKLLMNIKKILLNQVVYSLNLLINLGIYRIY